MQRKPEIWQVSLCVTLPSQKTNVTDAMFLLEKGHQTELC